MVLLVPIMSGGPSLGLRLERQAIVWARVPGSIIIGRTSPGTPWTFVLIIEGTRHQRMREPGAQGLRLRRDEW